MNRTMVEFRKAMLVGSGVKIKLAWPVLAFVLSCGVGDACGTESGMSTFAELPLITESAAGSATHSLADGPAYSVVMKGDVPGLSIDPVSGGLSRADAEARVASLVSALNAYGSLGHAVVIDDIEHRITLIVIGQHEDGPFASHGSDPASKSEFNQRSDFDTTESALDADASAILAPVEIYGEMHAMQSGLLNLLNEDPVYADISGTTNAEIWSAHVDQYDTEARTRADPDALLGVDGTANESLWMLHGQQQADYLHDKHWSGENTDGAGEAEALQMKHETQHLEYAAEREFSGFIESVDGIATQEVSQLHSRQHSEYFQERDINRMAVPGWR
jgi:hypothetical protein